jgi:hypothetical protein
MNAGVTFQKSIKILRTIVSLCDIEQTRRDRHGHFVNQVFAARERLKKCKWNAADAEHGYDDQILGFL